MPTNIRDPRSIITPEAFEIDESLLGTPLARPRQRLFAILLDILIIGVLTAFTSGIGLLIWGSLAIFLLIAAFRGPGRRMGQFTSVLFRGSTGCLGLLILVIVSLVGVASRLDTDELARSFVEAYDPSDFAGLPAVVELSMAEDRGQAEEAALALLQSGAAQALETPGDEGLEELLATFVGDNPEFTDDPNAFVREMVARFRSGGAAPEEEAPVTQESQEALDEIRSLSEAEVMDRYRQGLEAGRTPQDDPVMALLQSRVLESVAADTLAELQTALGQELDRRRRSEDALVEAQAELGSGGAGFVALLRDIWDQAGSAVGLWSIYFTVTLTLFKGYTVGKRAMGIRVVRLDGEPMNWWHSFERAGGYVAGIATGLLGFVQVYWDPNRQCVHDKIVGTVVIRAGAAPVEGGWESAWSDSGSPQESPSVPRRPRRASPSPPGTHGGGQG